jgi:undecaprenyl-diphosphatase
MIRFIFLCLGRLLVYRRAVLMAFAWIARFGYLAYVLYGLVEWFRPGRMAGTLYRRRTLLYCLFSVGLGSAASFVIGRIWSRPRPFVRHRGISSLIPHKENASFPSNHAMNSMAVALMLLSRKNWMGLPFLAGSVVLGASRVVCRLHYVSDVVGGFAIGAVSVWSIRRSAAAKEAATYILWLYDGIAGAMAVWRRRW